MSGVHRVGMTLMKPLHALQLDADFARMREMRHEEELTFISEVKKVGWLAGLLAWLVGWLVCCFDLFGRLVGWLVGWLINLGG